MTDEGRLKVSGLSEILNVNLKRSQIRILERYRIEKLSILEFWIGVKLYKIGSISQYLIDWFVLALEKYQNEFKLVKRTSNFSTNISQLEQKNISWKTKPSLTAHQKLRRIN